MFSQLLWFIQKDTRNRHQNDKNKLNSNASCLSGLLLQKNVLSLKKSHYYYYFFCLVWRSKGETTENKWSSGLLCDEPHWKREHVLAWVQMLLLEQFPLGQRTGPLQGQPISYMCTAVWLITRACRQLETQCEVQTWDATFPHAILCECAHGVFNSPPLKAAFPASVALL